MADLITSPMKWPPPPRAHHELTDDMRYGRFFLYEDVPCGEDDECYVALMEGVAGYRRYFFLRRFPPERVDDATVGWFKRIAMAHGNGLERIFELGHEAGHAYVLSELVEGVALDQLDARLLAAGRRLPWEVALALLFDATDRIGQLRAAGVLHAGVTPARLRLAHTGTLYLCSGAQYKQAPPAESTWTRALFAVARPILRLAATVDERRLLDGVLDDPDAAEALDVASDTLVVHHPELDPVMPAFFRALLDDAAPGRDRARELLADRLDPAAVRQLWAIVRGPA